MINLLINLLPIKKGGGQQVASNFIIQILSDERVSPYFIVSEGTYVHKRLIELKARHVFVVKNNRLSRLSFSVFGISGYVKNNNINLIYTMFGPGLFSNNVKSIVGCAYSNLFFPEIDFWGQYNILTKLKKKIIDSYRLKGTLKADGIIFENEAMLKRCVNLYNYPLDKVKLIYPSISEYSVKEITSSFVKRIEGISDTDFNIALITGWHKNKNIHIVIDVLERLQNLGYNNVKFIITVDPTLEESKLFIKKAKAKEVEDKIILFDSIKPHEIPLFMKKISAIGLFSLLESFSNNIIEAWAFNKPLLISNEEWSRAICKNAAIYVKRNNPLDIADKIVSIADEKIGLTSYENAVKEELKKYPTPKEKVEHQVDFLLEIFEKK